MSVLFIGKRFYTNRDALREKYGRIYQLPWHWSQAGIPTRLWLVDYHSRETIQEQDNELQITSTSVRTLAVLRDYARQSRKPLTTGCQRTVVASGDCYIGLIGYRIARKLHARFVFDVYDKYDEFGAYRRLPGFDPFRFLLRRADARLFASRTLMAQVGRDPKRDFVVPNGIDLQRFRPTDKQASRTAIGLPSDVTFVGYFGGMGLDRGVDDLIGAVLQLRGKGMKIELLLGGKVRFDMNVLQPGIRYLGDVPYGDMPETLASCDLLAVPYRRSEFMDAGASNKIPEAIACGRPLVVTRTPNFMENFRPQADELGDMIAKPGDVDDLARVIAEQREHQQLVTMPPGFDWEGISEKLAKNLLLVHADKHPEVEITA